ncbi:protein-L-isoaspartate O-methyltransferase family protein [Pararhodospirillum photometricum]|uniref:Protein-L-isoaspartate O-methyltransferase n=1 Tax=Pararhodospirillum photometricum DSM 122 TaxID=1150469 RepID=H6SPL3_PARPM|nr:protein-L-isoaspartate O-methyltransferase [Pararhodospirillum photometricum]CCG09538.1 Protein-L-isoaspartate(D-aspartate) O-methyltransferase [Pararhodospirillum photometricum DSM 122]
MDTNTARVNMIKNQIQTSRVSDPLVLEALEAVPRELFVPKARRAVAYVDEDIPVGGGRSLLEPLILARMLQVAAVAPTDVVLDVGCATGYSSAVLSHMASTVVALESDPDLATKAEATLSELGRDNAVVITGPLAEGCPRQAPFNLIFINGAVPAVPVALRDQLADKGRLVAVIRQGAVGRLTVVERHGAAFSQRVLFDADAPLLKGFAPAPAFIF